jgi:hypothetical protein
LPETRQFTRQRFPRQGLLNKKKKITVCFSAKKPIFEHYYGSMKKTLLFIFALFLLMESYGQVGINILVPDSSAALQVFSNKKGVGLPQLTTVQMNGIAAPLVGLTIFNTSDSVVEYWNGDCWLKAYQPNCYYCDFQMTVNPVSDTLDRTIADSVVATVTVSHTHGTQPIDVTYSAIPPTGVQIYTQGSTTIDSTGSFNIIVSANVFSGSGNIPILITAYCGGQAHYVTLNVYIKPCVIVNITNDANNYDVQAQNSAVLPAGALECVVVNVYGGVTLHSSNAAQPALTIGNLNANSIVGINNSGAILGRGGDGASLTATTVGGNPGGNGGNALNLTTQTIIQTIGQIYAGGGGGGSIGLSYSSPSIPIIGSISLGFGSGGGGGSESGQGGSAPSGIALGYYRAGTAATATSASVPGVGGAIVLPIPITISVATITITPSVIGGNGGGFAQNGTGASASISLQVCVQIPFIGNTCLPTFNVPIPVGGTGGTQGLAIERNGNPLTGVADGTYNGFQIKGTVAP